MCFPAIFSLGCFTATPPASFIISGMGEPYSLQASVILFIPLPQYSTKPALKNVCEIAKFLGTDGCFLNNISFTQSGNSPGFQI